MIKAAIFDMDGLLIDSEPFWRKAEIESFKEVGIHLTENDCRETMGYRLNEVVSLWYSRQPWTGASLQKVEESILHRVSEYIKNEGEPMEGALETIQICRKAGLKTAIASSSPISLINSVVNRFNLQNTFDCIYSAQNEEYGKPHPAVFISTAKKLGVDVHDCIVFEDSFHGIIAALAAKMKVVAVPDLENFNSNNFEIAHLKIKSLKEFDLSAFLTP